MATNIVEKIIYIKSNEDMEKARTIAAQKTELVLAELRTGKTIKTVAKNLGLTNQFVQSLAFVTGLLPSRTRNIKEWRRTGTYGTETAIRINVKYLDSQFDEWRLKEEKDGIITIETRKV